MNAILHDLRDAFRASLKHPGFAALIAGVLGAGLACVIFMLTLLDGFILRPLPFAKPDELLQAGFHGDGGLGDVFPVDSRDLAQIRRYLAGKADVAAAGRSTINLSDMDRPERYHGAHVTSNLFHVLGVAPALGRDFSDDDAKPGAPAVTMLSYSLWHARYGGDASIIGREVRVDGQPATVIGVMPKDFTYPRNEDLWVPSTIVEGLPADAYAYWVIARRSAGIGDADVANTLDSWFADAARADPNRFLGRTFRAEPLARMAADRTTRGTLGSMLAAVVMVLLVSCANAANLLLTRTLGRSQELAVRVALGASRRRLIAHLLAESVLLTLSATAIAFVLARAGVAWQQSVMSQTEFYPQWLRFDIDATVLLLASGAALFTALAAGLLPALRAGDFAVASDLRDGARSVAGGSFARVSRVLVVGEIALSCALLICVGTLVRGIGAIDRADLGIEPAHLLTARVALSTHAHPTAADQLHVYERISQRMREDAEVVDASVGTPLPGTFYNAFHEVLPAGAAPGTATLPQLYSGAVDAHFLGAYGVKLESGRFFDSRDRADSEKVAVVDRKFVERLGDGASVLGRRFRLDPRDPDGATVTIVGVIGPLTLDTPGGQPTPAMLRPLSQDVFYIASIAVRTRGDPLAFATRIDGIMHEIDADAPLYWVRDYSAVIRDSTVSERVIAKSFGVFGAIALALAAAGLYGVMVFTVSRRTREIGVRRALGAPARRVLANVFGRSALQLGIGLALGVLAGIPLARLLTQSLQDMPGADLVVVLGALCVLVAAAGLAVAVPVRRALRVDPAVALRHE
ncbi:MAG TPA: ADOP family duplicated permease [Rhodanobacteraceae bacterium]|jgi:predicted permease|nr:ADOP family duplicated permease [Rhodanobacteraceae bacterium]